MDEFARLQEDKDRALEQFLMERVCNASAPSGATNITWYTGDSFSEIEPDSFGLKAETSFSIEPQSLILNGAVRFQIENADVSAHYRVSAFFRLLDQFGSVLETGPPAVWDTDLISTNSGDTANVTFPIVATFSFTPDPGGYIQVLVASDAESAGTIQAQVDWTGVFGAPADPLPCA
jgi:hypothetical protein